MFTAKTSKKLEYLTTQVTQRWAVFIVFVTQKCLFEHKQF